MLPFPPNAMQGVRVLDLTRLLPGPLASRWFVDMGAEIIKVEPPGGDPLRRMEPPSLFASLNEGKTCLELSLKVPEQREQFLTMADRADVVLEGFRPGVLDALGCGWQILHARNPRLILTSISGYGPEHPYRDRAGHDINYLAVAGVLPFLHYQVPGVQIADIAGGSMPAVLGTLAALYERTRTGLGQHVEVSMMHNSALLLALAGHGAQDPISGRYACYRVYRCAGGGHIAFGALEPKFWQAICRDLQRPQWVARQWDASLVGEVEALLASQPAERWAQALSHPDCCVTPA
ncbi:MAG: CoA transferase [Bryobacterales bacterium]|nr:CoA transferase [Bryobacterales bacterium]